MGKAGRFACILTPMICTLISLLATVVVLLGGTNKNSGPISGLYFFSIDTRHISTPSGFDIVIPGTTVTGDHLSTGFNLSSKDLGLADFYTSSLWNYCSGTITNEEWKITECGKPSATYFFDIVHILNSSTVDGAPEIQFPDSVLKVNKAVAWASKVMIASYIIGLIATTATFVVGWFGLISRWGSCVTTIIADISFFFILTASIISTALYYSMREAYNKALGEFTVTASTNMRMYNATWLAAAFALAASVFWMFSTCCCSGRRARVMGTDHSSKKAVKTGAGYERIATPYMGGSVAGHSVPMTDVKKQAVGFEPYRHA